jgi:CRISPR-associated protein Cas1
MSTLYIDRKDLYLKLDGEAIAFYSKGEREGSIPINPLKRVIIAGNIVIESSVLNKLSQKGISILFLSGKRLRFCGILHGRLHNNGILRVKQYEKSLSQDFTLQIAIEIVKKKISGQKEFLMDIRESRPELRFTLTKAICTLQGILADIEKKDINMDTLRGLEGGASSAYFSAFTQAFANSLRFRGRNKRPPEDPVNAMLSLCYTLVHFEFVREIEVVGLDPVIGFYHQFDYGRESLACDLLESYRPEIDRFVWLLFKERRFTGRDFTMDDEKPGCYLKKGGRQRFYPVYEEWAKARRKLWADEVRSMARRILDGKESLY